MERCPVCRARLKDDNKGVCQRCGTDLSIPLMIENQAVAWRKQALRKLAHNDPSGAWQATQQALQLQRDPLMLVLSRFIEHMNAINYQVRSRSFEASYSGSRPTTALQRRPKISTPSSVPGTLKSTAT